MRLSSIAFFTVTTCLSTAAFADPLTLDGTGLLTGGTYSRANGISSDGSTVFGEAEDSNFDVAAFRWTESGGIESLGFLAGAIANTSIARAASADGSVIVGNATGATNNRAFRWTQAGGMENLGTLAGGTFSLAHGVNADGSVVVGRSGSAGGTRAFRWTQGGGMVSLGILAGGNYSIGNAVSADGSVVVGEANDASTNSRAFHWTQGGGMVSLGILAGGNYSLATGISSDGSVVVGYGDDGSSEKAFRWTQGGGMVSLGILTGGSYSNANAVSADGSVVVGVADDGSVGKAIRWTQAGGMESLETVLTAGGVNLTGWTLDTANGASSDGNIIVGTGTHNAQQEAFIASFGASAGVTTPANLARSLSEASVPSQQGQAIASNGVGQSMFAAGQALSSFGSPSTPKQVAAATPQTMSDYEPAAGSVAFPEQHKYAGYLVGTLAAGQDNNFNNYGLNGTVGLVARAGEDLAIGGGIIGGGSSSRLAYDGNSSVIASGGSAVVAYEPASGTRLYGTAMAVYLDTSTDRNYENGSGIDSSHGETSGMGYGLAGRGGYSFALANNSSIMPYGELQWSQTDMDAYAETGGAFPASYTDQQNHILTSRVGVEIAHSPIANLQLHGRTAWGHKINGDGGSITATTIGLTQQFNPKSGDDNWGEGAVGAVWSMSDAAKVSAEFSGGIGKTEDPATRLTVGLAYGF